MQERKALHAEWALDAEKEGITCMKAMGITCITCKLCTAIASDNVQLFSIHVQRISLHEQSNYKQPYA
jgi:hypothetical protein